MKVCIKFFSSSSSSSLSLFGSRDDGGAGDPGFSFDDMTNSLEDVGRMSREGIPVFVDIGQASSGRRSEGLAGKVGGFGRRGAQ